MHYIAEQFVRQYYLILQNSPWQLHHFYKDSSVYTAQFPNSNAIMVQGAIPIGNRIQETLPNPIGPAQEGKEHSCEIKNIRWMHQMSILGALVVSVNGSQVSTKTGQSLRFSQTFLLAGEPGQANAYFVNNDMVSFEVEHIPGMPNVAPPTMAPNGAPPVQTAPVPPAAPAVHAPGPQGLVPKSPPGSKPKSVDELPVPAPTPTEEAPPSPEKESSSPKFGTVPEEEVGSLDIGKPTIPASATPAPEREEPDDAMEEPVEATAPSEDPAKEDEEAAKPASPSGPMSWAAMAAQNKPAPKPAAPPKPAQKPKPAAAAAPAAPAPADGESKDVFPAPNAEEATPAPRREPKASKPKGDDENAASVFVSGVPHTCGEDKLREIFGKHGEVVKINLNPEKHYAIIDFNSTDAATEALKTTTLRCDSSTMKIEPRRKGGERPVKKGKGESRTGSGGGRGRGRDSGSGGGKGGRKPREGTN